MLGPGKTGMTLGWRKQAEGNGITIVSLAKQSNDQLVLYVQVKIQQLQKQKAGVLWVGMP